MHWIHYGSLSRHAAKASNKFNLRRSVLTFQINNGQPLRRFDSQLPHPHPAAKTLPLVLPSSQIAPSRQSTPAGTTPEPDGGFGDPEDPERMQDVIPSPPVTPRLYLSPSGLPIIGGVAPPCRQTYTSNAIVLFQPQIPTSRFVNFPPTGTNIATTLFQPQTPARSGFVNSLPTTAGSPIIDIRTPQSSPSRSLTRQTPRATREIENRRKREEEPPARVHKRAGSRSAIESPSSQEEQPQYCVHEQGGNLHAPI
jgi:hypothetical protein